MSLIDKAREASGGTRGGEITEEGTDNEKRLNALSTRIKTVEELLAKAEVDTDVWMIERYTVNQWEVGAKMDDGRIAVEPLFQVKAWLKRKEPKEVGVVKALREIQSRPCSYPKVNLPKPKGSYLMEMSIPDLHLGKLCWHPETGDDYDVKIAETLFKNAIADLTAKALVYRVSRILFILGNDYFNTDDGRATTAGTVQDEDGRWQKTFDIGTSLAIWAVDYLRQIAPVDVVIVTGNHDAKRTYYVGTTLKARYESIPKSNVTVNNEPTLRKYYQWGRCLIGLTHGNEEKLEQLADIMAHERPKEFSECRWRSWRLGHLHHHRRLLTISRVTHREIIVETLPSISGMDAWHKAKGYAGDRSAKVTLWHEQNGPEFDIWHWVKQ